MMKGETICPGQDLNQMSDHDCFATRMNWHDNSSMSELTVVF